MSTKCGTASALAAPQYESMNEPMLDLLDTISASARAKPFARRCSGGMHAAVHVKKGEVAPACERVRARNSYKDARRQRGHKCRRV